MKLKSITMIQQFRQAVEEKEDEAAVINETEALSWKDIDLTSDRLALGLLGENISKGDHVALWSFNSLAWICAYIAIAKIGGVSVLVNPKLSAREADAMMSFADVDYICFGDDLYGKQADCLSGGYPGMSIGQEAWKQLRYLTPMNDAEKEILKTREAAISPHDMASMLFTSGSTSRPKGILLTHYQLINVAREAVSCMHWTDQDKVCLALPLFHSFGLSTGLLSLFVHRGRLYVTPDCHSKTVMGVIDQYSCSVLNAVPSQFLAIVHHKERKNFSLKSLRSGIIAGSSVFPNDYLKIAEDLGIYHLKQSYGQTEASPSITFSSYDDSLERCSKTVGKVISNLQIRIISMATGASLGANQPGRIEVNGYNVMQGYYKDEKETANVLTEDGWLKTGDIGVLDLEGNLYIVGRIKEMIIRSGENISPKEIEEVIIKHEGVVQVKVFGIPMSVVQEEIVACVECPAGGVTIEAIRELIGDNLAPYKMPKVIKLYEKFPLNDSCKIDVKKMKEEIQLEMQEESLKNDF
ncbi:MAG: acyl--CoA ligase [Acetobacterium sp.]|nr:acyl--CoA ligase [Acetobacterium sp.]